MGFPEILVGMLPDYRMSKHEYNAHDQEEENSCNTCDRLEEPKCNVRFVVGSKMNFSCETAEIFMGLSGYMIKVHNMSNGVQQ